RKKLIRMLKDIHDRIIRIFFSKYSFLNIDTFKKLEIYGVQISGFKMTILCLDKPGFGLYRIRTIDEVTIPVNVVETNSIDRTFEGLM
ncbi:17024_t:CDS:2, partial [Funneliformis geosporum]